MVFITDDHHLFFSEIIPKFLRNINPAVLVYTSSEITTKHFFLLLESVIDDAFIPFYFVFVKRAVFLKGRRLLRDWPCRGFLTSLYQLKTEGHSPFLS